MEVDGLGDGPDKGPVDGTLVIGLFGTLGADMGRKEGVETMEVRGGTRTDQVDSLSRQKNGWSEGGLGGAVAAKPEVESQRDEGKHSEGHG